MRKEEECSLAQGVRDFLLQYPRKTIALDALQQQFGTFAYEVFHGVIQHLLQEGSLRGIVSSGTDFGGLPRRYRLIRARLCSSSDQIQSDAARYAISARLDLSFYHEQLLPVWQRDLPYIVQLSDWLRRSADQLVLPVSDQQRSWDIFQDEKFLLTPEGRGLLRRLHLSWQDIGVTRETEPLMMAAHPVMMQGAVCHHLIVENKAPYYKLLPHLTESRLSSLIFGSGWKIVGNLSALPMQSGCLTARHVAWYFGDMDWEGIRIFHALSMSAATASVELRLALPFYRALLLHEAAYGKVTQKPDEEAWTNLACWLPEDEAHQFLHLLQHHQYYPQETLCDAEWLTCGKELDDDIREFFLSA